MRGVTSQPRTSYSAENVAVDTLSLERGTPAAPASLKNATNQLGSPSNPVEENQRNYQIAVRQQPSIARSCGFGERDRRVNDPPPIVQLEIDHDAGPHRLHFSLVHCSIWDERGVKDVSSMPEDFRQQRRLMGTLVASPFVGRDENGKEGTFFCFPDLSCRTPGSFRLKFALFMLDPESMIRGEKRPIAATAISEPFRVYNTKDFPGMKARTPLTKSLNEQGCLITVKKGNDRPELSDEDECVDTVDEERSRPLHKREVKWLKAKHYPGSYPGLRDGNNRSREDQGARTADSALDTAKKSLGEADTSNTDNQDGSLYFASDPSAPTSPSHQLPSDDAPSGDSAFEPKGMPSSSASSDASEMSEDSFWFDPGDVTKKSHARFLPIESIAVIAVVSAYQAWNQAWNSAVSTPNSAPMIPEPTESPDSGQTTTTSSDTSSTLAASSDGSSGSGTTGRLTHQTPQIHQKRQKKDDDEPGRPQPPKRKRVERGARRLACPFQKRYPLRHFLCGAGGSERGFDTISHIKEHLRRCHIRSPIYCPRCKTEFDEPEERDEHISRAMVTNPPTSCLVDEICEHVLEYHEFTAARGAEVIREVIRSHGLLPETEDQAPEGLHTMTELHSFAERVFGLAAETIFRDWVSQRQPSVHHGQHQRAPPATPDGQAAIVAPVAALGTQLFHQQEVLTLPNSTRESQEIPQPLSQAGVATNYLQPLLTNPSFVSIGQDSGQPDVIRSDANWAQNDGANYDFYPWGGEQENLYFDLFQDLDGNLGHDES